MSERTINTKPAEGFTGIWYANQDLGPPYFFKYSGGLGTYPQQHAPVAIHCSDIGRTYFVYGSGSGLSAAFGPQAEDQTQPPRQTICCLSYYDHVLGKLARPRQLLQRDKGDAHENPVLCVDGQGHLLVFCPGHGPQRTAYLLRSLEPHSIDRFECCQEFPAGDNFSYPQPWWTDQHGLVFVHTLYEGNQRRLATFTSQDGKDFAHWDRRKMVVRMERGSYQVSWPDHHGGLGAAFDLHPEIDQGIPLNHRTNLYYLHTSDGGDTWHNADGRQLDLPLTERQNPALVYDAHAQGKLLYLKDLQYDDEGEPVIVYLTATSALPGADGGPHEWWLARHTSEGWRNWPVTTSSHCYDHGSLVIPDRDDWRILAPTGPGVDRYAAGGEMVLWQSTDQGRTWAVSMRITAESAHNHTYARRPLNPHPEFAWFWADGRGYEPSPSHLYFADIHGQAYRMPTECDAAFIEPVRL